jgi:nitroimidazol reductase NimA-like FMN-containing flavoprotein (pyridoxamine 5'-phosphate oxidase superfamily)
VARWQETVDSAPEFAAAVKGHLDARVHKTIATLRADGSPRISGIETFFADGDLYIGSMPNARKALDLRRDPRYALHSGSIDPPEWPGDAKLSGRAEEIVDPERRAAVSFSGGSDSHLFRLDIDEAVLVSLNDERTRMVVQLWRPGAELKRIER